MGFIAYIQAIGGGFMPYFCRLLAGIVTPILRAWHNAIRLSIVFIVCVLQRQ
jgi:hypothetical protein